MISIIYNNDKYNIVKLESMENVNKSFCIKMKKTTYMTACNNMYRSLPTRASSPDIKGLSDLQSHTTHYKQLMSVSVA